MLFIFCSKRKKSDNHSVYRGTNRDRTQFIQRVLRNAGISLRGCFHDLSAHCVFSLEITKLFIDKDCQIEKGKISFVVKSILGNLKEYVDILFLLVSSNIKVFCQFFFQKLNNIHVKPCYIMKYSPIRPSIKRFYRLIILLVNYKVCWINSCFYLTIFLLI